MVLQCPFEHRAQHSVLTHHQSSYKKINISLRQKKLLHSKQEETNQEHGIHWDGKVGICFLPGYFFYCAGPLQILRTFAKSHEAKIAQGFLMLNLHQKEI